nr:hypothetical protein CFP56_10484 [Quercus suber]
MRGESRNAVDDLGGKGEGDGEVSVKPGWSKTKVGRFGAARRSEKKVSCESKDHSSNDMILIRMRLYVMCMYCIVDASVTALGFSPVRSWAGHRPAKGCRQVPSPPICLMKSLPSLTLHQKAGMVGHEQPTTATRGRAGVWMCGQEERKRGKKMQGPSTVT